MADEGLRHFRKAFNFFFGEFEIEAWNKFPDDGSCGDELRGVKSKAADRAFVDIGLYEEHVPKSSLGFLKVEAGV